jgi:hypothetical protein
MTKAKATKKSKPAKVLAQTDLARAAGGAGGAPPKVTTTNAHGEFAGSKTTAQTSLLRNAFSGVGLQHFGNGDTVINRGDTFYGPKQGAGTPTGKK